MLMKSTPTADAADTTLGGQGNRIVVMILSVWKCAIRMQIVPGGHAQVDVADASLPWQAPRGGLLLADYVRLSDRCGIDKMCQKAPLRADLTPRSAEDARGGACDRRALLTHRFIAWGWRAAMRM